MFGGNKPVFGGFGQQNTSFSFGQPTTTASTNFSFGSSAAQPSGGLFGTTAAVQPTGGLFSTQTSQPSMFGTQPTSSMFGNTANQPTGSTGFSFGAGPTTGGLFGSTAATTTASSFGNTSGGLFGTTTTSSAFGGGAKPMFGATAAAPSGGLFGSPTHATPVGTTVKYEPVIGTDQAVRGNSQATITTRLHCISAMPQYEAKSLEELRCEDYAANRKGPQPGSTSMFTSAQPSSGGLFGAAKPAFGAAPASSSFSFGATSTAPKPAFGASTSSPFGASTAPIGGGGGLFGASNTTGGLFGQKPAAGGLFGQTPAASTSTGFSFGQTAPAATSAAPFSFGAPKTTSAFNFGATTAAPSGGLFGAKPAATTAPSMFNFGAGAATTPATGGLFGAQPAAPGTSLFGGAAKPAFGALAPQQSAFNFGATPAAALPAQMAAAPQYVVGVDLAQQALIQQKINDLVKCQSVYSNLFQDVPENVSRKEELFSPSHASPTNVTQYRVGTSAQPSRPSLRPRRRVSGSQHTSLNSGSGLFDELFNSPTSSSLARPENVKKLSLQMLKEIEAKYAGQQQVPVVEDRSSNNSQLNGDHGEPDRRVCFNEVAGDEITEDHDDFVPSVSSTPYVATQKPGTFGVKSPNADLNSTFNTSEISLPAARPIKQEYASGVVATRSDYTCSPALETITPDENGDCWVRDFKVTRCNYGSIVFEGTTNLRGLDLDKIVNIRRREVIVYPNEAEKPPEGEGLNKPSRVTLLQVYPRNKSVPDERVTNPQQLVAMNYAATLEKATARQGCQFIDYSPDSGAWMFRVPHFSRFGLDDEEDSGDACVPTAQVVHSPSALISDDEDASVLFPAREGGDPLSPARLGRQRHAESYALLKAGFFPDEAPPPDEKRPRETTLYSRFMTPALSPYMRPLVEAAQKDSQKSLSAFSSSLIGRPLHSGAGGASSAQSGLAAPVTTAAPLKETSTADAELIQSQAARRHSQVAVPSLFVSSPYPVGDPNWSFRASFLVDGRVVTWKPPRTAAGAAYQVHIEPMSRPSASPAYEDYTVRALLLQHHRGSSHYLDLLRAHAELARQSAPSDSAVRRALSVWQLLLALFSPPPSFCGSRICEDETLAAARSRHAALDSWLTNTLNSHERPARGTELIFRRLTRHDLAGACAAARAEGFPRLALLLARSGGERVALTKQLHLWGERDLLSTFDSWVLRVYCLLAGVFVLEVGDTVVDVCAGLSWLECFALHFWFGGEVGSALRQSVESYRRTVSAEQCAGPEFSAGVPDVRYQLLTLASGIDTSLTRLTAPSGHCEDPTDYKLSWLLLQVCESASLLHSGAETSYLVTTSLLESLVRERRYGLACAVASKSPHADVLTRVVLDQATRELHFDATLAECASLVQLPQRCMHRAVATRAADQRNFTRAFKALLAAGDWCRAHQVLWEHLLLQWFAEDNRQELETALDALAPRAGEITRWADGAGIFVEYFELDSIVQSGEAGLESYNEAILRLQQRVVCLPRHSPLQSYCAEKLLTAITALLEVIGDFS